jgi:hypothetical protein
MPLQARGAAEHELQQRGGFGELPAWINDVASRSVSWFNINGRRQAILSERR